MTKKNKSKHERHNDLFVAPTNFEDLHDITTQIRPIINSYAEQVNKFRYLWVNSPDLNSDLFSYLICYLIVQ